MNLDFEHYDRLLGSIPWFILLSIGNTNNIRYPYNKWIRTQIYFTRMEILFILISPFQISNFDQESVYMPYFIAYISNGLLFKHFESDDNDVCVETCRFDNRFDETYQPWGLFSEAHVTDCHITCPNPNRNSTFVNRSLIPNKLR